MEKRIRFGDLVRNSGRPEIVTLWTDPKKQKGFAKAIKENRVLTVIQQSGTQKDYGLIKFDSEAHAIYLVFPRPLPSEPQARVIGINYQLTEEAPVTDPVETNNPVPPKARPAQKKMPAQIEKLPPKEKPAQNRKFTVTIRRVATLEDRIKIEAEDQRTAEERALKAVRDQPFKVREAEIRDEVMKSD